MSSSLGSLTALRERRCRAIVKALRFRKTPIRQGVKVSRFTPRNNETTSALGFLEWHLATFQQAAARTSHKCVTTNRRGITQQGLASAFGA